MRCARWGLVLILLSGWTAPALAAEWGIGSNLGLNILLPKDDDENRTTFSLPGSPAYLLPGLRLSIRDADARTTWYLDTGYQFFDSPEFGQTSFAATLNVMRTLGKGERIAPYVTAGAGITSRGVKNIGPGGESVNPLSVLAGGGVGLRRAISRGAGSLRVEGRYDYVTEGEDLGIVLTPAGGSVGFRLGFDLWFR